MYGGLGDRYSFGLHDTSHYLAPVVAWNLPSDWTLRLSPGFGLNDNSHRFLLRWGVSREFSGFGAAVGRLFGGRQMTTDNEATESRDFVSYCTHLQLLLAPCVGTVARKRHSAQTHTNHQERQLGLCRTGEGSEESGRPPQSSGNRSRCRCGGGKLFDQHCAECHGEHGRGRKKGPKPARRRSAAGHSRNTVLAADQRRGPPRHAGLVQAARTAALATGQLYQVAHSPSQTVPSSEKAPQP